MADKNGTQNVHIPVYFYINTTRGESRVFDDKKNTLGNVVGANLYLRGETFKSLDKFRIVIKDVNRQVQEAVQDILSKMIQTAKQRGLLLPKVALVRFVGKKDECELWIFG